MTTINSSYEIKISDQNCFYNKATKHVHITSKFSYSAGLGTKGVWGYVPNEYRPTKTIPFKCAVKTNSGWEIGMGYINANGQITQTVASTATIIIVEADYHI